MTADRRRQIESLCLEALARSSDSRAAFLDEACAGDADLRREVDSLLAGRAGAAGFLEQPAWQAASTPLTPGTRLGPYEIQAAIGAGGMGEVYKARDTRLGRTVAIKVLPAGLASDPERRRRFEQEARAASALNHPHICALYDIGDAVPTGPQPLAPGPRPLAPVSYLVMEHLDGQTLAERLEGKAGRKSPLRVEEALRIGIQIADALAAAHKQGIIHRDLKPANVMLTKGDAGSQGVPQAKLLDFGLARLTDPSAKGLESLTQTASGVVVGTAPYMAPEQVEGKPTDARTDLFAFGAVLYEMLTGTRAFGGDSSAAVMAAILEREPRPLAEIAPLAPPALDRLIRRCLAKDPDARWDSAHDVAEELRWIAQSPGADAVAAEGAPRAWTPGSWLRRHPMWLLSAGLTLGAMLVGALMWQLRPVQQKPVARSTMTLAPAERLGGSGLGFSYNAGGSRTAFAWTPDGRALVFVGIKDNVRQLFVRQLDHDEAQALVGTDGAQVPAVSVDGQWVAFWTRAAAADAGAIQKVPIGGGPVSALAERIVGAPNGMAWGPGEQLLYGANNCGPRTCTDEGRIWLIRGSDPPKPVTEMRDGDVTHGLPQWLPGGQAFLYTARKMVQIWGDEEILVQSLATQARKVVLRNAADGRYIPTGHLVFMRMGILFAVPFDLPRLEVRGEPVALVSEVTQALTGGGSLELTGAGQYSVAPTGHLAYLPGPVVPYRAARLVSVDRHGTVSPLPTPVRSYAPKLRVSPDGQRLAVGIQEVSRYWLWVSDLSREETPLTSVTSAGEIGAPAWLPDGLRVSMAWGIPGVSQLILQQIDGTGPPQVLRNVPWVLEVATWTRDGARVIVVENDDIMEMDADHPTGALRPLVRTPAAEQAPSLSPDGHWLAYDSDRSGKPEVYVQPYPGPGTREQVSIDGGFNAAWNPRGGELFFLAGPSGSRIRMMAAAVDLSATPPRFGTPRQLFDFEFMLLKFYCHPVRCYDVAADGQRFYATQVEPQPPTPPTTQINLVLNWLEEVKAKVPIK